MEGSAGTCDSVIATFDGGANHVARLVLLASIPDPAPDGAMCVPVINEFAGSMGVLVLSGARPPDSCLPLVFSFSGLLTGVRLRIRRPCFAHCSANLGTKHSHGAV